MRPFMPEKARYTLEQLEIYGHGYYEALAAAVRVMQPAAKRWESRMKSLDRPHLVGTPDDNKPAATPATAPVDLTTRIVFWAMVVSGSVFILELLGLMGAAIYRMVR